MARRALRALAFLFLASLSPCLCLSSFSSSDFDLPLAVSFVSRLPAGHQQDHVVRLANRWGDPFSCMLPAETEKTASLEAPVVSAAAMLAALQGECFSKTDGWWTYQVCVGQHATQFHATEGGGEEAKLYLGHYASDANAANATDAQPYTQHFTHGSFCELVGRPRTANATFRCREDAADELGLVYEYGSCNYQLTIYTQLMCPPPPAPVLLTCAPQNETPDSASSSSSTTTPSFFPSSSSSSSSNPDATAEGLFSAGDSWTGHYVW
jgi:hypothetical protein